MNIEWLKNKTKEKFYPITHAKAVLFGNSNKTLDEEISDINNSISSHTSNTSNPHSVTKAQVGLGNVENKSSATIRGEITKSNVTTALGYTPLNQSLKGSASGLAELDSNGKVPSSQLPSFVDDVVEGYLSGGKFYKESAHTTEISGESGKIYIDLSTEKTYRWSGSAFVVISETLALGETSSTAYRGDRGKTAYDHSQSAHAPSNAEVNQNAFSNVTVGSTTIAAVSKTDTLTLEAGSNVTITPDETNDKITISSAHPSISKSTDSTSTASPSAGGTFTAVDSVTRDGNGHVTKVNTKTVTLPNTAVVVDSTLSSTSTNPVQNKIVYDALNGKSDTGHTHNYAGSNSAGGNALKLYLPREGNDANWLPDNGSTMQMRELHSMSSNLPEENFFQIIACRSGDEGYGSQLAMGMTTNNLYFRNYNNGNFNTWRKVAFADSYLPLSGGTLTGDLNIGGKVGFNATSEGGNIYWRSPKGVQWEFDCFNENFRLFNYNSYKDFVITRDEGDVHLPNNLYLGASAPILKLNDLYIHRNGGSNYETHIYGNTASYPHIMLRQYSNAFQFLPHTNYEINNGSHIGNSQYRFGEGYFTDLYNSSGAITTSDRNKKHDIEEISDDFSEKIVDGLIPSSFKFNDGSSGRTHFGIIAQDLEKLLESLGISTTDFAPLVKEYPNKEVEIENPDYDENDESSEKYIKKLEKDYDAEPIYNVRYEEFIMILVKYCQGLKKKDLDLEQRISELEEKVNKLIAG